MKRYSVSVIIRGMGPNPGDVTSHPGGRLLSNNRKRLLARRGRGRTLGPRLVVRETWCGVAGTAVCTPVHTVIRAGGCPVPTLMQTSPSGRAQT